MTTSADRARARARARAQVNDRTWPQCVRFPNWPALRPSRAERARRTAPARCHVITTDKKRKNPPSIDSLSHRQRKRDGNQVTTDPNKLAQALREQTVSDRRSKQTVTYQSAVECLEQNALSGVVDGEHNADDVRHRDDFDDGADVDRFGGARHDGRGARRQLGARMQSRFASRRAARCRRWRRRRARLRRLRKGNKKTTTTTMRTGLGQRLDIDRHPDARSGDVGDGRSFGPRHLRR